MDQPNDEELEILGDAVERERVRERRRRHNRPSMRDMTWRQFLSQLRISNRKQLVGCIALSLGTLMVVVGLSTQAWITGTVETDTDSTTYNTGLLKTTTTRTSSTGEFTETFDNTGDTLQAGETALSLGVIGLLSATVSAGISALLAVGMMANTQNLGHSLAIWGAFCGGLSFIVASIAYSAVVPKVEDPLTFGWSFILVLTSGFFILIGGLIFVLSKQETENAANMQEMFIF